METISPSSQRRPFNPYLPHAFVTEGAFRKFGGSRRARNFCSATFRHSPRLSPPKGSPTRGGSRRNRRKRRNCRGEGRDRGRRNKTIINGGGSKGAGVFKDALFSDFHIAGALLSRVFLSTRATTQFSKVPVRRFTRPSM